MSHAAERHDFRDKARAYEHLAEELGALLAGERDTSPTPPTPPP